jgi:hypothetical protein
MSVYSYLCCTDCKVVLWLGKATNWRDEDVGPKSFARGDAPDGLNWKWEILNQVLWKMLAEHTGHTIRVVLEHEFEKLLGKNDYMEIGGDRDNDIAFEQYLREKKKD